VSWLLNVDQPVAAAPAQTFLRPAARRGVKTESHSNAKRRQGSDAGLDAVLRWGIDHEESRAAAIYAMAFTESVRPANRNVRTKSLSLWCA